MCVSDGVSLPSFWKTFLPFIVAGFAIWIFYFEKIRVFKAGFRYEYISME
jgi:hypothetical protein